MDIPHHLKLTREEVRKEEAYKNLTDEQADELIELIWGFSEILFMDFVKEENSKTVNATS